MADGGPSAVKLDIIIVGAGISGLATAISSALSGHNVTVFESAKELLEVGAGLQVTPNSTRILQKWGLADRLWKSAAEPTSLTVHRYSGKVLAHEDHFDRNMRAKYDAPFLDMHRVDMQRALVSRAEELGVQFRLGEPISTVDFDAAEVTTKSGTRARGDVVVAADGVWSRCQAYFLGGEAEERRPLPTGDLAYRLMLSLDDAEGDEELQRWIREPTVHFWIGPGAHAVGYSMRAGQLYNLVLLVPDDLPEGVSKQKGSLEEMKALFKEWDPILKRFLEKVDTVEKWRLMHREALPSWVNDKGNFAFVGDSCHPMLPYLAQGANSAVEDGAVLGQLLGHIQSKDQIPKALKMYEKLRKVRGEAIVRETFKQRHDFHMLDGPEQEERDALFLSMLGKELKGPFPSRWTCPEVQPWLYGYDASREVEEAVRCDPF
ncbi:FAD binding domain-containing protein [Cryphonectria parasitica EP155]|uniref:FAD binding domain-containing protein n=1 Tax=Cryphonectria parasitica (strain ATCC 38755 / EP155) TaxID=660469 RepID=A0A9P4Y2F2_CRYP1|nr:FAD binding domain-containing protein [Cryphonectria parasitica EP155]KAF3765403.1 FAD binding domain-containing protein [Cryphonectria parasitica EP155]